MVNCTINGVFLLGEPDKKSSIYWQKLELLVGRFSAKKTYYLTNTNLRTNGYCLSTYASPTSFAS